MRQSTILFAIFMLFHAQANAQDASLCSVDDHACLFRQIEGEAVKITEPRWRNQAYRDLAVSMAMDGEYDNAASQIDKIDNADTQAMTVRAIGMAVAIHQKLSVETYRLIFSKLDKKAATIKDPGAKDIAYTYIAMAQAFAGLDDDATKTTDNMSNPALKHKAFGETAEIQAERGDYDHALKSINAIDSTAFRNKALYTVADIFIKRGEFDNALKLANQISNPTKKIAAIQDILNARQGLDKAGQ